MKKLAILFLLFPLAALAQTNTINVTYRFADFQLLVQPGFRTVFTPLQPFADYTGAILSPVPKNLVTDTNGTVVYSNTVPGYSYRIELDTPYGSTIRTSGFPSSLSGNVNGRDYLGNIKFNQFYFQYISGTNAAPGVAFLSDVTNIINSGAVPLNAPTFVGSVGPNYYSWFGTNSSLGIGAGFTLGIDFPWSGGAGLPSFMITSNGVFNGIESAGLHTTGTNGVVTQIVKATGAPAFIDSVGLMPRSDTIATNGTLNALAIGNGSSAAGGTQSIAYGGNSTAGGTTATAIGYAANAANQDTSAFGNGAMATANNATALGYSANASAQQATAIGEASTSAFTHSTALGVGSTSDAASEIMLGTTSDSVVAPANLVVRGTAFGSEFGMSNSPNVLQLIHQTRANLANLEAGSNVQFTIDLIADSDAAFELWTKPLFTLLQAAFGNAGMGWTAANDSAANNGDSGAPIPLLRDIIQLRVTYAGTWTFTNDQLTVPLISSALSSDTGTPATLTWTNVPGTGATLWFLGDPTVGGSFQILTNGAVYKTINSVTASTTLTYTNIPLPSIITNYTIQCKLVSGQMAICGLVPTNNLPGIRINNRGHTGSAAKEWAAHTVTSPTGGTDTNALQTILAQDNPQLVFISLFKNDSLHYAVPGTYTNDLTTIISQVQKYSTNCDIVLLGQGDMAPPNGTGPGEQLMRTVSVVQNIPYIDIYDRMPTYQQATNQPVSLFQDLFHFTPAGYLQQADLISRDAFGVSLSSLRKLAQPIWYYQMPLDNVNSSDAGWAASQNDPTFSIRRYWSLAANPSQNAFSVKIPNGLGFNKVISKYTLAPTAVLGATNFYCVINTTGEKFNSYLTLTPCQSEAYPITNGQAIVVWATNYFDNDTQMRDLLVRFFKDTANSAGPTNAIAILNAEYFGVRSNAWLGQVIR